MWTTISYFDLLKSFKILFLSYIFYKVMISHNYNVSPNIYQLFCENNIVFITGKSVIEDDEGPLIDENEGKDTEVETADVHPIDINMSGGPHLTTCNSLEQDDSESSSDSDGEDENEELKLREDEKVRKGMSIKINVQ